MAEKSWTPRCFANDAEMEMLSLKRQRCDREDHQTSYTLRDSPFQIDQVTVVEMAVPGSLTPHQRQLLQRVKDNLNTGGLNRVELYPDSRRYVLEQGSKVFKDQLRKSLMLDAVDLALLLTYFGWKAALGSDVVNNITGKGLSLDAVTLQKHETNRISFCRMDQFSPSRMSQEPKPLD
ncbi:hypothetical protein RvY_15189 [Ramazzottius varieornatus]|uniref:Uncharacterized protein n=1 Tax=Ramazzottius varieornatus TaxID=947166 RepID=A0A1D1VU13_RAMVA|nr:hypothetical protein RvY_15189 [Ramazzottius varieornatus]